jgi:hypothetical protein
VRGLHLVLGRGGRVVGTWAHAMGVVVTEEGGGSDGQDL